MLTPRAGRSIPSWGYSFDGPSNPPSAPLTHNATPPGFAAACRIKRIGPRVVRIVTGRAPSISNSGSAPRIRSSKSSSAIAARIIPALALAGPTQTTPAGARADSSQTHDALLQYQRRLDDAVADVIGQDVRVAPSPVRYIAPIHLVVRDRMHHDSHHPGLRGGIVVDVVANIQAVGCNLGGLNIVFIRTHDGQRAVLADKIFGSLPCAGKIGLRNLVLQIQRVNLVEIGLLLRRVMGPENRATSQRHRQR